MATAGMDDLDTGRCDQEAGHIGRAILVLVACFSPDGTI